MATGTVITAQMLLGNEATLPQHAVRKNELDAALGLVNAYNQLSFSSVAIDDTTTATTFNPFPFSVLIVSVSAGSGVYSKTVTLDGSSLTSGALVMLLVKMSASTNPTITLSNGSTFDTLVGTGTASDHFYMFGYDALTPTWHRLI